MNRRNFIKSVTALGLGALAVVSTAGKSTIPTALDVPDTGRIEVFKVYNVDDFRYAMKNRHRIDTVSVESDIDFKGEVALENLVII